MERAFYRVTEAAEILGLSRAMAYRLVKEGKIPSVTIAGADDGRGGCVRIPRAELVKYIERQPVRGTVKA